MLATSIDNMVLGGYLLFMFVENECGMNIFFSSYDCSSVRRKEYHWHHRRNCGFSDFSCSYRYRCRLPVCISKLHASFECGYIMHSSVNSNTLTRRLRSYYFLPSPRSLAFKEKRGGSWSKENKSIFDGRTEGATAQNWAIFCSNNGIGVMF